MNQNTTMNRKTRSKLARSDDRAGNDTRKTQLYEAWVCFTHCSHAVVTIEAASLGEAEEKADKLQPEDFDNWKRLDGDLTVESVELIEGDQDDE
jgi:hypothetical protein